MQGNTKNIPEWWGAFGHPLMKKGDTQTPPHGFQIFFDNLKNNKNGLVGVPLATHESNSNSDSDLPIDGPDGFTQ